MSSSLRNHGFSLIEILIGIVLLAIALLAIAGMQIASIRGNSFGANMTQASYFGQSGLEVLRGLAFQPNGDWPAALSPGPHNFGVTIDDVGLIPGTAFTRAYTVTQHPTNVNIRIVQLTINWTDKGSHALSFSMMRATP
jgi:prepilin-type N-terminal cleavage/methylation domain-containing protein